MVPRDLSGCLLWLRGDSLKLADGAEITQWNDESGNSNHAILSTGIAPYFKANAINGRPAVKIMNDTTDRFFNLTVAITTLQTFVMVMKWFDATTTSYAPLIGHNTAYDFHGPGTCGIGNVIIWSAAAAADWYSSDRAVFNGAMKVPTSAVYTGTPQFLTWATKSANGRMNYLSRDRGFGGRVPRLYIAEIACYDRQLRPQERSAVESYVKQKYGLSGSGRINPVIKGQPGLHPSLLVSGISGGSYYYQQLLKRRVA